VLGKSKLVNVSSRNSCRRNSANRKSQCDESGPPCRSCAALDIPCTFERPSRRRGPPNRHAEAVKRQRLEQDGSWSASALSPTEDAAHSLASLSGTQALSAESICDIHTLRVLIDDYFTYIHPLTPLPHEPTFRAAFEIREDRTNRTFLALLAAMIEALVASFPRRPRQLFTSESNRRLFPNAGALIDRCQQVFNEARGPGYLDREISLYDAFSSYLVGLTAAYLFDSHRAGLYVGECVCMVRRLALHKAPTDPSLQSPVYGGTSGEVDFIKQELSRRLFWLAYVSCHSWRQLGDVDSDMLMALSARKDLPSLPLEIDDAYIYQDRIVPQPPGIVSIITGFNLNVRIFKSCSSIGALESAFGIEGVDWEKQKQLIGQSLYSCKVVTDGAPQELQVRSLTSPQQHYSSPVPQIGQYGQQQAMWADQNDHNNSVGYSRRNAQYEIQKANIYASQLGTRSFLVEKYWDLFEVQNRPSNGFAQPFSPVTSTTNAAVDSRLQNAFNSPTASTHSRTSSRHAVDVSEQAMALERENIVRDLATFLQSVEQMYMEPNGLSIVSTLFRDPLGAFTFVSACSELVCWCLYLRKLRLRPSLLPFHPHKTSTQCLEDPFTRITMRLLAGTLHLLILSLLVPFSALAFSCFTAPISSFSSLHFISHHAVLLCSTLQPSSPRPSILPFFLLLILTFPTPIISCVQHSLPHLPLPLADSNLPSSAKKSAK
jgi:hypothetical protein